jgi:hypothetical protein
MQQLIVLLVKGGDKEDWFFTFNLWLLDLSFDF